MCRRVRLPCSWLLQDVQVVRSDAGMQVYNVRQAKTDIDAVYSMGLFDDVTILPQPSDDSTPGQPKASTSASLPDRLRNQRVSECLLLS